MNVLTSTCGFEMIGKAGFVESLSPGDSDRFSSVEGPSLPSRTCSNCGRATQHYHAGTRCQACATFLRANRYDRPDELIAKAGQRRETSKASSSSEWIYLAEPVAMTRSAYNGPEAPKSCACGCHRLASALHDGYAPYCAQLAEYKAQRGAA